MRSRVLILAILSSCWVASPLLGQGYLIPDDPKPAPTSTPVVTFEVDPAPEPVPALKYRLLPPLSEIKPGNAAPIYLRPFADQSTNWIEDLAKEHHRLSELPLERTPVSEIDELAKRYANLLTHVSAGARRASCDWEYPLGKGELDPVSFLMPDVQQMRSYSWLLTVKLRGDVAARRFNEAIHTLQTGLAFARHLSQGPNLVNKLVGLGTASEMLIEFEGFVVQPGAPNMYWALAALPNPYVEIVSGLDFERDFLFAKFPELRDLDRPRSDEEWQTLEARLRAWSKELEQWVLVDQGKELDHDTAPVPPMIADARAFLSQHADKTDAEIAAMSDAEVTVRYTLLVQLHLFDTSSKYAYLPVAPAGATLDADQTRHRAARKMELIPLSDALVADVGGVLHAQAFRDRRLALLQTVEALRLYAAEHADELPERLDQLFPPAPENPITGEPFEYTRMEDGTGQIKSPPPAGANPISNGIDWRIKVRKPAAQ